MLFSLTALLPLLALAGTSKAKPIEKRYTGVLIVSGRTGQCLTTVPRYGAGYPVTTQDCSFPSTTRWDINPGSGSVLVSGSNGYALDAGSTPSNNGGVKIWTSYPGLFQQTWYLTDDNRIAITGGDQCLDQGDNGPQTYRCTPGNTNQVWYIRAEPLPPASSSVAPPPPPSSSVVPPPSTSSTPPTVPSFLRRQIHPRGDTNLCLTVIAGATQNGYEVGIATCLTPDSQYSEVQTWDIPYKFSGPVRLSGTNFCLDAGSNPASGTRMKIWQCYDGVPQQTWRYGGDSQFSLASGGQCLDTVEGQGSIRYRPIVLVQPVQTWQCFPGNQNQAFTIST